jgi:farnesyl-diphosphate farnesyltransferase
VTGEITAEQAKKREEDAENKSDMYFLMGLMGIIIFFVAGVMVCCLDLLGRS